MKLTRGDHWVIFLLSPKGTSWPPPSFESTDPIPRKDEPHWNPFPTLGFNQKDTWRERHAKHQENSKDISYPVTKEKAKKKGKKQGNSFLMPFSSSIKKRKGTNQSPTAQMNKSADQTWWASTKPGPMCWKKIFFKKLSSLKEKWEWKFEEARLGSRRQPWEKRILLLVVQERKGWNFLKRES